MKKLEIFIVVKLLFYTITKKHFFLKLPLKHLSFIARLLLSLFSQQIYSDLFDEILHLLLQLKLIFELMTVLSKLNLSLSFKFLICTSLGSLRLSLLIDLCKLKKY